MGGIPLGDAGLVEADFSCNCPCNFEGICKHSIAFGLAVIDQFGPVIERVDATPSAETPVINLNTLWQATSDDQKLDFLHQLLDKQSNLRAQFAQFSVTESTTPTLVFFTPADNVRSVDSISQNVFSTLSNLRFDDDGLDMEEPAPVYYNLKSFEPLLLALVTDTPSARAVQQAIEQHTWQKRGTEYVQLHLADVLQDAYLWLKTADQFANYDPVIALQLLQRRWQMGNIPVLIQTLHRLTNQFPTPLMFLCWICLTTNGLPPALT